MTKKLILSLRRHALPEQDRIGRSLDRLAQGADAQIAEAAKGIVVPDGGLYAYASQTERAYQTAYRLLQKLCAASTDVQRDEFLDPISWSDHSIVTALKQAGGPDDFDLEKFVDYVINRPVEGKAWRQAFAGSRYFGLAKADEFLMAAGRRAVNHIAKAFSEIAKQQPDGTKAYCESISHSLVIDSALRELYWDGGERKLVDSIADLGGPFSAMGNLIVTVEYENGGIPNALPIIKRGDLEFEANNLAGLMLQYSGKAAK